MISSSGPQFADFFRRLRARSVSSFEVGSRRETIVVALARLEELTAQAESRQVHHVPPVENFVLVEQLAVLFADAEAALVDEHVLQKLMVDLARVLAIKV